MATASATIEHSDCLFIDGEWVHPSGGDWIEVITPSTEELYMAVPAAQAADVNRAVAAARRAFDEGPWPRMSHAERAGYVRAIGEQIALRSNDLGEIWTSETGATRSITDLLVPAFSEVYNYYASLADSFPFLERHHPKAGGNIGLLAREPVGVVAAIVAWNGPLGSIAYKCAPALLAGCTIIVKASPEAPSQAYAMAEIMEAVGLPKGVFNVLAADRDVSELLVRHPGVDKVTFTGSSTTGRTIASICGGRMARFTMELGGKSAGVVLDDYDPEVIARSLAQTAPILSGQVCSSLTRIIVTRGRQEALLEALRETFSAINVGDPFEPTIGMGPLATRRQRERVEGYIQKGEAERARLVVGGRRPANLDRGFFIEPTVFGHVDNNMMIAREEIFGPVVSVIPVENEEEAIRIANDSEFGLNSSVFTNDANRAYEIARRLRTGTVGHNSFRSDFSIAFGGFKQSGIGREGGTEGLLPFLETKTIILDEEPAQLAK